MQERITQAIFDTLPGFLDRVPDPYDINCGLCEEFAHEAIDRLGGETGSLWAVWLEDTFPYLVNVSHKVICWGSGAGPVYFDSECPEGTRDVNRIPVVANRGVSRVDVITERARYAVR
jgi:hypothetical protein